MRSHYMKKITSIAILLMVLIACSKNKFESKPSLKVTSLNKEVVPKGDSLTVTFEFTDKEGDVDSALFLVRRRLNVKGDTTKSPERFTIPSFPDKNQGEIQVTLSNSGFLSRGIQSIRIPGSGTDSEPDTMKLSFFLADQKGNRSDTAVANVIVIR